MVKHEPAIVDAVEANLHAHVFDHDTSAWAHVLVSDLNDEAVDALVLSIDMRLSKHDSVVGMASAICDPELLAGNGGRIDLKFLFHWVVDSSGLHLWRVVAVTKLGEAEAAHVFERVNISQEGQVAVGVQGHQSAAKQVELDSELGGKVAINHAKHLVGGKNVLRIIVEVEDGDNLLFCDSLDLSIGSRSLLVKRNVKLVGENWVLEKIEPFLALFRLVVENDIAQLVSCSLIEGSECGNSRIDLSRRHHF